MKILFIADNFPPETNAPATRTYEHCLQWVKSGHDVTVITCFPNFPQGSTYHGYRNRFRRTEFVEGIKVIRVWSYIAKNEGFIRRTIDFVSFSITALVNGLFEKCDILISTSPQFFTCFTGYFLHKIKRKPWVLEIRDLWPESILAVGALKQNLAYAILLKLSNFFYTKATSLIVVTKSFKANLVDRKITPSKIIVLTNGANLDLYKPRQKDSNLLKKLKLEGKFIFGYVGTHGMAHSLDFIVECIKELQTSEDVHFIFIGDGATKASIIEIKNKLSLNNLDLLDPVPKDKVPEYLSIMDVVLVPLRKSKTFKEVIPSKIFESAAMLKPCLLGVEGEACRIVTRYNSGIPFTPEDKESFLNAIKKILNSEKLYAELQQGCLKLSKQYDRNRIGRLYLKHLVSLSSNP